MHPSHRQAPHLPSPKRAVLQILPARSRILERQAWLGDPASQRASVSARGELAPAAGRAALDVGTTGWTGLDKSIRRWFASMHAQQQQARTPSQDGRRESMAAGALVLVHSKPWVGEKGGEEEEREARASVRAYPTRCTYCEYVSYGVYSSNRWMRCGSCPPTVPAVSSLVLLRRQTAWVQISGGHRGLGRRLGEKRYCS